MKNNTDIIVDKIQKALLVKGGRVKASILLNKIIKEISVVEKQDPSRLLEESLENIAPLFTIKTRKQGKKVVQTPIPIFSKSKRYAISSRWVVKNSKKHRSNSFIKNILAEINDSINNQGFSKKQQQELNKLVVLNRSSLMKN